MIEEKNQKSLLKKKIELKAISEWVGEGQRVLDLGCGRGILLNALVERKNVYAVGVDSDFEKISLCIKKGVNAYHGDIMDMLSSFDDNSFDWIVCSRTLPELENASKVISESLRVARHVAVGFVNYAYWRNRLSVLFSGDRVVNEVYPDRWQASRPMNTISVNSFRHFCVSNNIKIVREHFLCGDWEKPCKILPNLFSGYALFDISKEGLK